MRDHNPIVIDKFNGLFQRGSADEVPLDHFIDCDNLRFIATSSFGTRPGIGISQDVDIPLENVKRIYNYPTPTANTIIVLTYDYLLDEGNIYHVVNSTTVYGPLLTITGMIDFAFVPYAGRGYISPFGTFVTGDLNIEKGLENEFLYVYAGDGTAARKSAGISLTGALTIANGAAGHTDAGFHLFGFVSETLSGYLSPPGAITGFTTSANFSVSFGTVPVSGDLFVTKRYLVATKVIPDYSGDPTGYTFYFVPNATINNNTDAFLNDISFFDEDLLDDASHLFDNYTEIPAGAALSIYNNRLCLSTTFDDISLILVSAPGEPEAISQVDGLIVVSLDGNPITNMQEMRDVFYVMKRSKTVAYIDNGDAPASWPETVVDTALGTSVHGIATVLDSGSSSVDFLIICTYQGVTLFNGKYNNPELSWKIEDFWRQQDRNDFRKIQVVNTPVQKLILIILPDNNMLVGNYANGMDDKAIRWSPWSFAMPINTVAIVNIDEIILGSDLVDLT